jgi:RNA polymerase sigma-B factor
MQLTPGRPLALGPCIGIMGSTALPAPPTPQSGSRPVRRDRDDALLRRYHRDRDSRDRTALVQRWLPLARQLASRYHRGSEPFDDLVQVASIGLIKAIDGFDPSRGIAFSSYAVPTILGELRRHFRDRTWSIRVPRRFQELALSIESATRDLTSRLGHAPTVQELASAVNASQEDVLEALNVLGVAYRPLSLEKPAGDDDAAGATIGELLGTIDDGFVHAEHRATLARLLPTLSERDQEVLRLRFEDDLTQTEIAARVGVSQMQISRILRRSLARLRLASDVRVAA